MPSLYASIDGWFDYSKFYDEMINQFHTGGHFVEVGCWEGRSGVYLLEKIKEMGSNIKVDFVDHWNGDPDVPYQQNKIKQNGEDSVYTTFTNNIKSVGVENYQINRIDSVTGADLYQDNSLEFVYLDASHYREQVVADIQAWLPKVKSGCVLAGHDYDWADVRDAVHSELTDVTEKQGHVWVYIKP